MKTRTYILTAFTLSWCILVGCSDPVAGPHLDTEAMLNQEIDAGKAAAQRTADLSVHLRAQTPSPTIGDSLGLWWSLYNAGPDAATGVRVVLQSGSPCTAASLPGGKGRDIGDDIIWDIISGVQPGETATLDVVCPISGPDSFVIRTEVEASDAQDPDSVPGNGDPTEDDYDLLVINPEPPCSSCQP